MMKKILPLVVFLIFVAPLAASAGTTIIAKPSNNIGLVGLWTMDGSSINWQTGLVSDLSGQGNTGHINNLSTTTAPVAGKLGQALKFSSAALTSLNNTSPSGLPNIQSAQSYSAWVNLSTTSPNHQNAEILNIQNGSARMEFGCATVGCYVSNFAGTAFLISDNPITTNAWHFVTYTYDGTNNNIYIDGVVAATPNTSPHDTGAPNTLEIGGSVFNGGNYADGKIDDVRIYNRALTATEIKALYNSGAAKVGASSATLTNGSSLQNGLVGLWTFDGVDTGSSIVDRSSSGNNGYFWGSATSAAKVAGKLGQALNFSATNVNSVRMAGSSGTANNLSNMSVSAWIKSTYSAALGIIMQKALNSGAPGWFFALTPSGGPGRIEFAAQDGTHTNCSISPAASPMNDGRWHLVSATLSGGGNGTIKIYIDGVDVTDVSCPDTASPGLVSSFSNAADIWIGDIPDTVPMNGTLDDVRIYNRTLSPSEEKQLYNLGKVVVKNYCGLGSNVAFTSISGGQCRAFMTSGSTFTVPSNWNNTNNTIEVIGGGGAGQTGLVSFSSGAGGPGGAYSKVTNTTLTPLAVLNVQVGAGGTAQGAGSDTYFNRGASATTTCSTQEPQTVCAKGGDVPGTSTGGLAAGGIGTTKFSGGGTTFGNGAGGGAAGIHGNGVDGGSGGAGDAGFGGAVSNGSGPGGSGTEWDATHGSGGGGSNNISTSPGTVGGNYGAGGGGGSIVNGSAGGDGAGGLIVITYRP